MSCRSSRRSSTRIARFMGYPDAAAFAEALLRQLDRVRATLRRGLRARPGPAGTRHSATELDFRGDDPAPAADHRGLAGARLHHDPERIVAAVRGWQAGHVRALRSLRARELMAHDAAGDPGARWPPAQSGRQRSTASTGSSPHCPPACNCCRCSSAIPPCWIVSPPSWAPPRRWPNTCRATRPRWKGCSRPRTTAPPAASCEARLGDADRLEDVIEITRRAVKEEDFYLVGRHAGRPPRRRRRRASDAARWPTRRWPRCCRRCWRTSPAASARCAAAAWSSSPWARPAGGR